MSSNDSLPPNIALMHMVTGYRVSQVLYVTTRLGIADLLKSGPKGSEELAKTTLSFQPALERLLRSLVSLGIVTQDPQDRFGLTPLGTYLQADHPLSLRPYILFIASEPEWQSWGNLEYSVLSGKAAFNSAFGIGLFEYNAQHPEFGEIFNKGMAAITAGMAWDLVKAYDFSQFERVIDVGGGNGSLLRTILKANPAVHGVLFDLPEVVCEAAKLMENTGVSERCEVVGGDFFKMVPEGGNIYILKLILHDWSDEKAAEILKSCYNAMDDKARLLVVEQLSPENVQVSVTHQDSMTRDLNMLVLFGGGQDRNQTEFRCLFVEAGFDLLQTIPFSTSWNIIEAIKNKKSIS